jgi:hypothetical protein
VNPLSPAEFDGALPEIGTLQREPGPATSRGPCRRNECNELGFGDENGVDSPSLPPQRDPAPLASVSTFGNCHRPTV